jgi:hypothetical protein
MLLPRLAKKQNNPKIISIRQKYPYIYIERKSKTRKKKTQQKKHNKKNLGQKLATFSIMHMSPQLLA